MRIPSTIPAALAAFVLAGLMTHRATADGPDLEPRDRQELLTYARDTWRSVAEMAQGVELPVDGLRRLTNGSWQPSPKTTPTDIGAYLWSVLAAERLKFIDAGEAHRRLARTLDAIGRMERARGFFCDTLDPHTGAILRKSPYDGTPILLIASSVDNAWLATGLIVVKNAYPGLHDRAEAILRPMDFSLFYAPFDAADPHHHPGLIREPYFVARKTLGGYDRIINTEQRITSYIAIARGQFPPDHYYHVERTLKPEDGGQSQKPEGEVRNYRGIPVFEGHYTYRGIRIVPSWGGSMFEALMVPLFVPEERWAPRSWGINHPLYVRAQIEYGLDDARYGFWGFSPACDPAGGYRTYGVHAIASNPRGYTSHDDPSRGARGVSSPPANRPPANGIVTPHASFLALRYAPRAAMENLRKLKARFPIYGDHGFLDSVNVSQGIVADRVLMLDQGMIMAAIANALADDAIRDAFVDEQTERTLRPLIEPEEFTAGTDPPINPGPHRDDARLPRTRPAS